MALMMEALQTFETSVSLYQSTRRYNPEGSHLQTGYTLKLRTSEQNQNKGKKTTRK
jgi:hypothetical protein